MLEMVLQISLVTFLMCLLNILIWRLTRNKTFTIRLKLCIGVVFGLASVLLTQFGITYEETVLNVRDIAPLSAALFFDPISGIVAGLIGGIERYIEGRFFDIGTYTTLACSISTILSGFVGALFSRYIFKGKHITPIYALFIGGVMEVFHMLSIFITHGDDISNAFIIVDTCAIPMILFTGLGMFFSSLLLALLSGEYKSLHKPADSEIPIAFRFQLWLFIFIVTMAVFTFMFSYIIQTRQTVQTLHREMEVSAEDIKSDLECISNNYQNAVTLTKAQALNFAHAIAREIDSTGGITKLTSEQLYELRSLYGMYELNAIKSDGYITASTNPDFIGFDMRQGKQSSEFLSLLDGTQNDLVQDYMPITADSNISVMYAGAKVSDGAIEVGFDDKNIKEFSDLTNYADTIFNQHIGKNGYILVADSSGTILAGELKDKNLSNYNCYREDSEYFVANIFNTKYYCLSATTDNNRIVILIPYEEAYLSRNISAYELAFADILLFALVFILIYILVQKLVVDNLDKIVISLDKITHGNLDEVISVHSSSEFAALSNDINATVATLKRYIAEAENRIAEELEFASSIQASALPHNFKFPNRDEFKLFASMHPAKEIGGDFYDFFFVDSNRLALVIADVSGKGIPAALFMMRSKATIKNLAELGKSPSTILQEANSRLCEGNEAEMFVTAWIGIIDLKTGVMTCANAGHEYPAIRYGNNAEYELYKDKHGFVLGGMDGVKYKEYEIELTEGSRIFVYTDGVTEANNRSEEQFGAKRMLLALNETTDLNVNDTLKHLEQRIFSFCDNAAQFDDITMMCLEYTPQKEQ